MRATLAVIAGFGLLAACESATNLDVSYADGGAGSDTGVDGGNPTAPPEFAGCPCDTTLGEGCCLTSKGTPFCTTSIELCREQSAIWLECAHPSAGPDSDCCWHGGVGGRGSFTTYRGECDGGVRACSGNEQCPNGDCHVKGCGDVQIGACGQDPVCP